MASRGLEKKKSRHDATLKRLDERPPPRPASQLRWEYERALEQRQQAAERLTRLDQHGLHHLHPQEPEARVMRCDPRRLFSYNVQAVVDHEHDLVVAIGLSADETDHPLLVPMLQQTQRVLGQGAKQTVADTGYASGEQLHRAQVHRLPVLVQVQGVADLGLLPKSSFTYHEGPDAYQCPRGAWLTRIGRTKKKPNASYSNTVYRCHTADCPERAVCSKDRSGRAIQRSPFDPALERQRQLLAQPALRTLYGLRKEIVEHLFGCIKGNDGFRRFTVRGRAKAFAQWALACLAFNLRKLHRAWVAGQFRCDRRPAQG